MNELDRLISGLDHDGLVRYVDGCCASRDWQELLRVRDKCLLVNDSGRQMWPITTLANYRLALHAPAEFAVYGLEQSSTSFLFGPLSEVIAQNHSWDEIAPLIQDPYQRDVIAHERALRGDSPDVSSSTRVFDIPHDLQPWEPRYTLPLYTDNGVQHDPPHMPALVTEVRQEFSADPIHEPDSENALRAIVEPWSSSSNGRVEIAAVESDASAALAAIGVSRARMEQIPSQTALEWLVWAGASGGAHGRRRGVASGRYAAWWALAALGGISSEWPIAPDEVGLIATQLKWFLWDVYEPHGGWRLQLLIEDPVDGLAWAINARDTAN